MFLSMFGRTNQFQVRFGVVPFVEVDVMDMFVGPEAPADLQFHQEPMLAYDAAIV